MTACSHRSGDNITDVIEFGDGSAAYSPIATTKSATTAEPLAEMPGEGCIPIETYLRCNLAQLFNDSNNVHLAEAQVLGIEPLETMRSHWHLRRPLKRISSCADFYIEELTYSHPYLVPEGAAMVHEVGRRFRDTLAARGGGDYRIRITSVLRTPEAVSRLRRINSNAIDSSVHRFGTTVDISYANFAADSPRVPRRAEDLKIILAEVLFAMRNEGKIFVKYERKQPCFHITCRRALSR